MTQQQGWSAPVPPPQRKKRRKWPWVLLGVVLLLAGGCAALIVGIAHEVGEESGREITVTYEVTGDAKDVTITYATYSDGDLSQNQVTDVDPPWRKQLKTKGFVKGGRLVVTTGASGGTVHCRVTADGTTRTATASGVVATAVCDGF
ncbi:MmpS family transport accessory protein [Streptomyces sp. AN091965]|uniref:MmpS family transport accessory protein n=1 Tax=Streptomyces sp. AN091965 TaxID=2927803 RepID=UPI001F604B12|nr:MmpS family transport accessory protein [Streptomyces sp. AN091965]MCI3929871.1 MmpS family transport accessory protein [Streptomyces sp. AN091965]